MFTNNIALGILFLCSFFVACAPAAVLGSTSDTPRVNVQNGTLLGLDIAEFGQEAWLGIPYAEAPVGPLRLRRPASYGRTFNEFEATSYSPICYQQYGNPNVDGAGYPESEDCLTLNVVRPSGTTEDDKLPVMVWIYGGGLIGGGSAMDGYNGSWLVQQSVNMKTPVIFVSLNYRLNAFGYLSSSALIKEGSVNLGYYDQRLALHWIQENVGQFGGDPGKVTIFGESAGGWSVGAHLLAYGGRDDSLFRSAILQSGPPQNAIPGNTTKFNEAYRDVLRNASCLSLQDTETVEQESNAQTQLTMQLEGWELSDENLPVDCLRSLSVDEFRIATSKGITRPVIDGEFVLDEKQSPSWSLVEGAVVKVPVMIGTNTDEMTQMLRRGYNSSDQIVDYAKNVWGLETEVVDKLMELYPDDPYIGIPANTGSWRPPSGAQNKRVASFLGDLVFHAASRFLAEKLSALDEGTVKVWKYRFNERSMGLTSQVGVTHAADLPYVFGNPKYLRSDEPVDFAFSELVQRTWLSFVVHMDPNGDHSVPTKPHWPSYSSSSSNMVFQSSGSVVEPDVWREEAIKYINERILNASYAIYGEDGAWVFKGGNI